MICYIEMPFIDSDLLYRDALTGLTVLVFKISHPTLSVLDHGFKPVKPKYFKIGICCFSTQNQGVRAKTVWLGIMIMCLSAAICLPVDLCFSELSLYRIY